MNKKLLTVSLPPHESSPFRTRAIMLDVLIALTPAFAVSLYVFGVGALLVTLTAVAACVLTEYVIQRYLLKKEPSVSDLSAVVTGVLLAFNVPSNLPLWMVVLAGMFAIGIAKMCYGGLGMNIFNPALIGRVFLLSSFPVAMTSWPSPLVNRLVLVDAVTSATPLGILKEGVKAGEHLPQLMSNMPSYLELFFGVRNGCIGEVSVAALLVGFLYLLYRKVITWHIPVIIVVVVVLMTGTFWLVDPMTNASPLFHILTGGVMLGAIFMATDYTTSPMTYAGMVIYAVGIGVLVTLIRLFGSYPEGMSFAILIMNAMAPLIDRWVKPYRFGEGRN